MMRWFFNQYIQPVLRGVGQVLFQNSALSGLLFLLGIYFNSVLFGCAAIIGAVIGTCAAKMFKYPDADIQKGLYGFNGVLVAIAMFVFFKLTIISCLALFVGVFATTVVMRWMATKLPPFTAPFVLVTWILLVIITLGFHQNMRPVAEATAMQLDVMASVAKGFGQVMFQNNSITGIFFLAGILINSRVAALYAVYASVLGLLLGWGLSVPFITINGGLLGYNGILVAIALAGKRKIDFLWVTVAVLFSIFLQIGLSSAGVITLTAPFVLATWAGMLLKKKGTANS